jgi:hypothetical protein
VYIGFYGLSNVTSLLRIRVDGASPEVKFFIVCLCYLSEVKAKAIEGESPESLANKFSVSVKSAQQGIRFLVANGFISKDKNWLGKDKLLNVKYEFTEDFYSYIKSSGASKSTTEADNCIGILMDSEELKNLSKRVAVKLLLLTLLAHSDKFGVVRGLSVKDFHELLGGFTKDKHRSQLAALKVAGFIIEYSAGMSGGILLGKEKSEYLVNINHKAFYQCDELSSPKPILIKKHFRDDFFSIHRFSAYLTGKELYRKNEINSSERLMASLLAEIKGDPKIAEAKLNSAINAIGNAFDGDVRAFQIQRYVSRLAMGVLRSTSKWGGGVEAVCNSLKFNELFSNKFLRDIIIEELGEGEDKAKLSQKSFKKLTMYYKQLEFYMNETIGHRLCEEQEKTIKKGCTEQISAITWLVSLCVIYTAKEYCKLLTEKGFRPNKQTETAIFSGKNEISLYFFELDCIDE